MSSTVISPERTQTDALTSTLTSAFSTDPYMLYILGSKAKDPASALHRLYAGWISHIFQSNTGEIIHTLPNTESVAVWSPPERKEGMVSKLISNIALTFLIGWAPARRLAHCTDIINKGHPDGPCMYLAILGTHEDYQGQGKGADVMKDMLQKCDQQGIPVYTESSNPRNLSFYKRRGFVSQGPVEGLPDDCPLMTRLWREPQKTGKLS